MALYLPGFNEDALRSAIAAGQSGQQQPAAQQAQGTHIEGPVSSYNDADGVAQHKYRLVDASGNMVREWWQSSRDPSPQAYLQQGRIPLDRYYDASGGEQVKYRDLATGKEYWEGTGQSQPKKGGSALEDVARGIAGVSTGGLSELAFKDSPIGPYILPSIGAGTGALFGGPAGAILGTQAGRSANAAIGQEDQGLLSGLPGAIVGGMGGQPNLSFPGVSIPSLPGADTISSTLSRYFGNLPSSNLNLPGLASGTAGQPGINSLFGSLPTTGDRTRDLGILAGLGLTSYGLAQGPTNVDLSGAFVGAPEQTRDLVNEQLKREEAARQVAEAQYLAQRGQGRQTLEDILGRGSEEAFRQAIQKRQEQLNTQGLLGGPSGAMDFALAQEAANLRRQALPYLTSYEGETLRGLEDLRNRGLMGATELQRTGLGRQLSLGDVQRNASLAERLYRAEQESARKRALLGLGTTAIGYGVGGTEGAKVGSTIGSRIEDIFAPRRGSTYGF